MRTIQVKMPKKDLNKRLVQLEQSREDDYGSFNRNMKKIAAAWSILLDPYLKSDIPAHVVPLMYAQAKLIRATFVAYVLILPLNCVIFKLYLKLDPY